MTETPTSPPDGTTPATGRRKAGLEGMLLPELKQLASGLGLKVSGMRKGQIVEAIKATQTGGRSGGDPSGGQRDQGQRDQGQRDQGQDEPEQRGRRRSRQDQPEDGPAASAQPEPEPAPAARREESARPGRDQDPQQDRQQDRGRSRDEGGPQREGTQDQDEQGRQAQAKQDKQDRQEQSRQDRQEQSKQDRQEQSRQDRQEQSRQDRQEQSRQDRQDQDRQDNQDRDDDQGGSRRNRRRRGRDRTSQSERGGPDRSQDRSPDRGQGASAQGDRTPQSERNQDRQDRHHDRGQGRAGREPDLQILEDDVLTPCAGILDLMDNYAFVRTGGYLPGVDDVYVSMSMVRKHGLRRGDAVVGQVRQPREGERKEKFNPLVRIDSVNGADPETARKRVEFANLTPLNPTERLRMETGPGDLVGRLVDLVAPIGKGQRGLVVAPPKSGKTAVLQALARSVTTNNPECHLMVVLVDERPEEVTDFERSVKGEVISSTFDRPPSDHTVVAELAIERAMRLVELGLDVVVLLDGLTRLGRAYNLAQPSSGRALPGGVDIAALHPPKRLFGAARKVENGGSLTIIATTSVETGSRVDEVVFEELQGTANMELRLRRELAEQHLHPAVDLVRSGTRREELLLGEQELEIVGTLRRALASVDEQAAFAMMQEQLKGSGTNVELLRRVQQRPPVAAKR